MHYLELLAIFNMRVIFTIALAYSFLLINNKTWLYGLDINLLDENVRPTKWFYLASFIIIGFQTCIALLSGGFYWDVYGYGVLQDFFMLGNYTHAFSILNYSVLWFYCCFKFRNVFQASTIALLCISIMEFSCIPEHALRYGWILPHQIAWYFPFVVLCIPFLLTRGEYRFPRTFYALLVMALIVLFITGQMGVYCSAHYWDWELKGFMPDTSLVRVTHSIRIVYYLVARAAKALYALAFAFVGVKER